LGGLPPAAGVALDASPVAAERSVVLLELGHGVAVEGCRGRSLGEQIAAGGEEDAGHVGAVGPAAGDDESTAGHRWSILMPMPPVSPLDRVPDGPAAGDDVIVVRASAPLAGEVRVPGAKNSVLKLMAA